MKKHECELPQLTVMGGRQLSWECSICGRIFHPVYSGVFSWWEETKGPSYLGDD